MHRLGILGSTRGTNLLALLSAKNKLQATIEIVLSNKADALILQHARDQQLQAEFINPEHISRVEYDKNISARLRHYQVTLVVLIGYMRILTPAFVAEWPQQIINVHPSLLPAFAGSMNHDAHRAVLAAGVNESGCSVHYVTEEVDAGPIILQKKCAVLPNDTVESLKTRVQTLEGEALIEVINSILVPKGEQLCKHT